MAAPAGNKYAVGANSGKPPAYSTPEELMAACDGYFEYIKGEGKETPVKDKQGNETDETEWVWDRWPEPATVTGLALYLGFESRQSLYDYGKKQEYSYIIKRAKTLVENGYERNLHTSSPAGAIFALKNMNWIDKTETENKNTNVNINSVPLSPERMKEINQQLGADN